MRSINFSIQVLLIKKVARRRRHLSRLTNKLIQLNYRNQIEVKDKK